MGRSKKNTVQKVYALGLLSKKWAKRYESAEVWLCEGYERGYHLVSWDDAILSSAHGRYSVRKLCSGCYSKKTNPNYVEPTEEVPMGTLPILSVDEAIQAGLRVPYKEITGMKKIRSGGGKSGVVFVWSEWVQKMNPNWSPCEWPRPEDKILPTPYWMLYENPVGAKEVKAD